MIHTKHSPRDCEVCAAQVEADELGAIPTMGHTIELESTPDPKPDTRGVVMSRDTILRDNEGNTYSLDSLATQKWLEGHYSGLDECCGWLEEKAATLFRLRKRNEAAEMQNLADELRRELRPKMIKHAEEHEREYPWQLERESVAKAS